MEIVKITRGLKEQISVLRTLATMEEGEQWTTNESEVQLAYAQVCCSRYSRLTGKSFSVNSPASLGGQIIITRNR